MNLNLLQPATLPGGSSVHSWGSTKMDPRRQTTRSVSSASAFKRRSSPLSSGRLHYRQPAVDYQVRGNEKAVSPCSGSYGSTIPLATVPSAASATSGHSFSGHPSFGGGSASFEMEATSKMERQETVPTGPRWTTGRRMVYGEPFTSSVREFPGEERVIAEYFVEREMRVPKKTVREDVVERTYVVPERIIVEEFIEEDMRYLEKIVEIARPVIQEKVVEVPEVEFVERIVEIPQKIVQEKMREVPIYSVQERVVEVPKIMQQERVVEVPVYEYRERLVEKVVEVPEIREEIVYKEVPVPHYVETLVAEEQTVEIQEDVPRNIPIPTETRTQLDLVLPKIRPIRTAMDIPVYVPRFVEVPVPAEFCSEELVDSAERCGQEVRRLMLASGEQPLSLTALDGAAALVQAHRFEEMCAKQDFIANFVNWWRQNQLSIDEVSLRSVCRTVEDTAIVTEAVSLVRFPAQSVMHTTQTRTAGQTTQYTAAQATTTAAGQTALYTTAAGEAQFDGGGLEIAVIPADGDAQSVKTDRGESDHLIAEKPGLPPPLARRDSIDSGEPVPESDSMEVPRTLSTPCPVFPIMKGMETREVSAPLGDGSV